MFESIDWAPLLLKILEVFIAFMVAAIVPYVVAYLIKLLKAKIEEIKSAPVKELIYWAIREAQQRFPDKPGNEKLAYVSNLIHAKFPSLPEAQVRMLIEAFVFKMKSGLETINLPKVTAP
jgi:hypothetical protein